SGCSRPTCATTCRRSTRPMACWRTLLRPGARSIPPPRPDGRARHGTHRRNEMATRSEVVHCYSQLASGMALMAELARAREWDRLPALEAECAALVDRLRALEPLGALEPTLRAEAL